MRWLYHEMTLWWDEFMMRWLHDETDDCKTETRMKKDVNVAYVWVCNRIPKLVSLLMKAQHRSHWYRNYFLPVISPVDLLQRYVILLVYPPSWHISNPRIFLRQLYPCETGKLINQYWCILISPTWPLAWAKNISWDVSNENKDQVPGVYEQSWYTYIQQASAVKVLHAEKVSPSNSALYDITISCSIR